MSLHQLSVPLAHFVTQGLLVRIRHIIVGVIEGFKQSAILVTLDEFFNCQHKQAAPRDLQFLSQVVHLFKERLSLH